MAPGESSLLLDLYSQYFARALKITAHRQTWFESKVPTLSASDVTSYQTNIRASDRAPTSRWRDTYSGQRTSMAISALIDAENMRARSIANAVDARESERASDLSQKPGPIKAINSLLRESNLPIKISIEEPDRLTAIKDGSELDRDNVLTAKPGTLLIIDEPDRHLHRSIVSPLLSSLFARRRDCAL
jgi:hypothetical protein